MHIAIDDTYGTNAETDSRYVTPNRRTAVAVVFSDDDAAYCRRQIVECLDWARNRFRVNIDEFHFSDIYNRRSPWDKVESPNNLAIIGAFARIYQLHRWPVHIQTIDDRTLSDHDIRAMQARVEGLDLADRAQLALFALLVKLKHQYPDHSSSMRLVIDAGTERPGTPIGKMLFREWGNRFEGCYGDSATEPLLQCADFVAFMLNRSQYLSANAQRSETDRWFLHVWAAMEVDSPDITRVVLNETDFSVDDFDYLHWHDRQMKGLPPLPRRRRRK